MLLQNKSAVIYGAGGAIGGAVARAFAREGAKVFLAGRHLSSLEVVVQDIATGDGLAEVAQVDACDQQAIERHLADVIRTVGSIDISFNAIGIDYVQGAPLIEMSLDDFALPLADVMRTQFLTTTAAARHMTRQGSGVILAITATPARIPVPNSGSFGVACAAIENFCGHLAAELGPQGIRVVCLRSAGSPDAPTLDEVFHDLARNRGMSREAFEANVAEGTMLKRLPKLDEVANMAVLMASDYASAATGTVANVTCGQTVD